MKALHILIAVAILNIVGVSVLKANPYDQPNETFFNQKDKQLHMGFSFVVGVAGNAICKQQLELSYVKSWWCGLGTALLVGAIKEATDTNWDNQDMLADGIGGIIGTTGMWTIYKFQSGD